MFYFVFVVTQIYSSLDRVQGYLQLSKNAKLGLINQATGAGAQLSNFQIFYFNSMLVIVATQNYGSSGRVHVYLQIFKNAVSGLINEVTGADMCLRNFHIFYSTQWFVFVVTQIYGELGRAGKNSKLGLISQVTSADVSPKFSDFLIYLMGLPLWSPKFMTIQAECMNIYSWQKCQIGTNKLDSWCHPLPSVKYSIIF